MTILNFFIKFLRRIKRNLTLTSRLLIEKMGYTISKTSDYYSPLPIESELKKNINTWNTPSLLHSIKYCLPTMKGHLNTLVTSYLDEFLAFEDYECIKTKGFGPGFPKIDAFCLYMMIRHVKPKRYVEVGSGLSTYYCSLAAKKNKDEGFPLEITCIEPYPYEALYSIESINIIKKKVQTVEPQFFNCLDNEDILFIDSSHVVKIDGDVPFLYLEILPQLKKDVWVHIHDIPFPYNTPYPAQLWVLEKNWPMYWNEAMLVQAFLAFNTAFSIYLSTPLIRFHEETFLETIIPFYESIIVQPNTFSSLWIKKNT